MSIDAPAESSSDPAETRRLVESTYWNAIYDGYGERHSAAAKGSRLRRLLAALLPPAYADVLAKGYAQHLIDAAAIAPAFPVAPGWQAIEIGSAPGHYLVDLHRRFGYEPFGIEYTEAGVDANRRVFAAHGISTDHVIHADFFSKEFLEANRGRFDVVFSIGFIEHFDDPRPVIARHVDLLRDGGRLLIVIPNLHGVNRMLAAFFHPGLIDIHNTDVMVVETFKAQFDELPLRSFYQGFLGVFSLRLLNTKPDSWKRRLLPLAMRLQQVIDLGLFVALRGRHPESAWRSPYLVYSGEKTADNGASPEQAS